MGHVNLLHITPLKMIRKTQMIRNTKGEEKKYGMSSKDYKVVIQRQNMEATVDHPMVSDLGLHTLMVNSYRESVVKIGSQWP